VVSRSEVAVAIGDYDEEPTLARKVRRFLLVLTKRYQATTILVLLMAFTIVLAPILAPYSPTEFHGGASLRPPGSQFLLGTDQFGRDTLSRILYGARLTLLPALASAALGALLGSITGIITGYKKGMVDEVVMRVMDALMSFPALILALLIIVMLGSNPLNVIGALGVVFWPRSARLVRSAALEVSSRDFIAAAQARGEGALYVVTREILPNVWPLVVVDGSLRITYAILLSASLAYLGVGVTPPSPAWGLMIQEGQKYFQLAPWMVLSPCFAVALSAVTSLMLGQALRSALAVRRRPIEP
jgi:peptide/nickel transport system permease protein